jgi:gas vesicle protein
MLTGLAIGAATMFLLDPERGRRRRAEVGQRLTAVKNDVTRMSEGRAKDLRNRAQGFAAEHDLPGSPPKTEAPAPRADSGGPVMVMDIPADAADELRRTDELARSERS